ncbi:MAG: UDP-N-acetylmuramoyl-tripeptide--D-alanyl-D-alanine ligase [Actinomycetota bacterium]|nr:UDP-N-acetylmuramoyl-tripeptide--D-alanyl-D-alanine ligase [Actinomycetota bacterium]
MGFEAPFPGYSTLLRVIVYGITPAFMVFQIVRLRRALHVFQLEGYKRARFLTWCRRNPRRALFLARATRKKPLVMTGRAWRILGVATFLSVVVVLGLPAAAHPVAGAPLDWLTWVFAGTVAFVGMPVFLTSADALLAPVQNRINERFITEARRKLDAIAPTVVGITGSYGKTSTKFAVRDIAGEPGLAYATPGSYNTPMGVTRAINEGLNDGHELLVVEMGAYGRGDIAELCAFVRPTISILTAIGPMHLDRFGSMDAIRAAKYEIVEALPPEGVAVMNTDDLEVRRLADATTDVRVVRYGMDPTGSPEITARDHSYGPHGTTMTIVDDTGASLETRTSLLGEHSINHVLAGVTVARLRGLALADLGRRIAALQPVEHRLQLVRGAGGVTIIDDAFNSNPAGAAAALEILADLDEADARRKIVVTPGMIELGERQFHENKRFAEHASLVADHVIVVGSVNRDALCEGIALAPRPRAEVITVDTLAQATEKLAELKLGPGDWVLFENDLPDHYEG